MIGTRREVIQVRNWSAVPKEDTNDEWYICDQRGFPTGLRGLATGEDVARQWLEDATGISYEKMPAVKLSELTVQEDPWRNCNKWPYRGDKFRHVHYFLGNLRLGSIQYKNKRWRKGNVRVERLTISAKGGCVRHADLAWLLKDHGFRLIKD